MTNAESRWRQLWLSCGLTLLLCAAGDISAAPPVPPSSATGVADSGPAFRCDRETSAPHGVFVVETKLAGVPAILRVPAYVNQPPIVLWHGFGPSADERSLMGALP